MISFGAQKILRKMIECEDAEEFEDAELVCEGNACWLGCWRTTTTIRNELLSICALRDVGEQGKGVERYTINAHGRKAAADRSYIPPELYFAHSASGGQK
ncbi:MAG: hypothetical protein JWP44_4137 [Mucilaginibacter sp.]|nr:hypothetical protein [Mucilaginibacter sp.]